MRTDKPLVMIVDDEPKNLDVLEAMLRQSHYEVSAFLSGDLALDAAREIGPDLVLLDIRMPELDGYEVCRRLKLDDDLCRIPVIFLSALSEMQDKLRAFEAGAVDYVSKPLSQPEVIARVRAHLALRKSSQQLEELVRQRTLALEAANQRLRALDEMKTHWISMLAHELRTPLTGVFYVSEALFKELPSTNELYSFKDDFEDACDRIRRLIDDASLLAEIHWGDNLFERERTLTSIAIADAVAEARKNARDVIFAHQQSQGPSHYTEASCNLLKRALKNLLITAALCTAPGKRVTVSEHVDNGTLFVEIATQGKSLPQSELAVFFDLGEQRTLHKGGADFGLGPALAYHVLKLFECGVSVRNGASEGVVMTVTLPLSRASR